MNDNSIHRAIDAVWRIESAKIIAGRWRAWCATSALAEELAQDALVARSKHWPDAGVPDQPGRLADGRRPSTARSTTCAIASCCTQARAGADLRDRRRSCRTPRPTLDAKLDDDIGDDLLRLMFIACHPVLSTEARVALTLRLLGGLTTDEIARAFLVPEADRSRSASCAPSARWPRRKVPFEVPRGARAGSAPGLGAAR